MQQSTLFYGLAFISALLLLFVPIYRISAEAIPLEEQTFFINDSVRTTLITVGILLLTIIATLIFHKKRSWRIGFGLFSIFLVFILVGQIVARGQKQFGFPLAEDFSFIPHIGVLLLPLVVVFLILGMRASAKEILPLDDKDKLKRYGNVAK